MSHTEYYAPHYVVGFMLSADRKDVVLIRKNRPAWQAGSLNGVGGKIEPGETPAEAMAREFYEETDVTTVAADWQHMCTIRWPNDLARVGDGKATAVEFFRMVWPVDGWLGYIVESKTDEVVEVVDLGELHFEVLIPNLHWLLPLAAYTADTYQPFVLEATVAEVHPVDHTGELGASS